jgi:hypothetical protein
MSIPSHTASPSGTPPAGVAPSPDTPVTDGMLSREISPDSQGKRASRGASATARTSTRDSSLPAFGPATVVSVSTWWHTCMLDCHAPALGMLQRAYVHTCTRAPRRGRKRPLAATSNTPSPQPQASKMTSRRRDASTAGLSLTAGGTPLDATCKSRPSSGEETGSAGSGRALGRAVVHAADGLLSTLGSTCMHVPSNVLIAVESGCKRLRPWQQRLLGVWMTHVMPHLCPTSLLTFCLPLTHCLLPDMLSALESVAWQAQQSRAHCLPLGAASTAVRCAMPDCSGGELPRHGFAVEWLFSAISLLRKLQCDTSACVLVVSVLMHGLQHHVAMDAALLPLLALTDSLHTPLAALGLSHAVADGLMAGAAALVKSGSMLRATDVAAAAWRLLRDGPQVERDALRAAIHCSAPEAARQLLLQGEFSCDIAVACNFVVQGIESQRSGRPAASTIDEPQPRRGGGAHLSDELIAALHEPSTDGSTRAVVAASRVLRKVLPGSATPAALTEGSLALAVDATGATVDIFLHMSSPTRPLPPEVLRRAAPLLLAALEELLASATVLEPPPPGAPPGLITSVALLSSIIAAVSAAVDSSSATSAATMARALALAVTATAYGALHLPTAVHLCQVHYDSGTPGSHLVLAVLLSDVWSATDSVLQQVRALVTPGTLAVLEVAQQQMPAEALRHITGTVSARRCLLPDALSAPGPAGRRASVAADMLLSSDATRLALLHGCASVPLHGSHLEGTARCTKIHPTWAVALVVRLGRSIKMTDMASLDWSSCLSRLLAVASPAKQLQSEHLVSAALDQLAFCTAQHAPGALFSTARPLLAGRPAKLLAASLLGAFLLRPAVAPVLIAVANSQGMHASCALFDLLNRGIQHTVGSGNGAVGDNIDTCVIPVGSALTQAAGPAPEGTAFSPFVDAQALLRYIDVYLQLLSRMDPPTWRERSDCLVQHISVISEAAAACARHRCSAAVGAARASDAPLPRKLATAVVDNSVRRVDSFREVLWLRLELLMPLMPMVYSSKGMTASKNQRHRLALALVRLIAALDTMDTVVGRQGSGEEGKRLHRLEVSSGQTLRHRILLVLHMLLSDEWARWITCHQTRGKPQSVGFLSDSSSIFALFRDTPMPPASALSLASVLDSAVPSVWASTAVPNSTVLSMPSSLPAAAARGGPLRGSGLETRGWEERWRAPWCCLPALPGHVVWNAKHAGFERGGSHAALAHVPRTIATPPRFGSLAQGSTPP